MEKNKFQLTEGGEKSEQGVGDSEERISSDIELRVTPSEAALLVRAVSVGRMADGEFTHAEHDKLKTLAKKLNRLTHGSATSGIKKSDSASN